MTALTTEPVEGIMVAQDVLHGLRDTARSDAAGTHFDAPDGAVAYSFHLLQIWIPDPAGFVVGVAHIIAEAGALAAYFTHFGHDVITSE
jgi:hypothetical protein